MYFYSSDVSHGGLGNIIKNTYLELVIVAVVVRQCPYLQARQDGMRKTRILTDGCVKPKHGK